MVDGIGTGIVCGYGPGCVQEKKTGGFIVKRQTTNVKATLKILLNLLLFTTGIFLFAWFIHGTGYLQIIALGALLLPCIALYRHTLHAKSPWEILHIPRNKYFPPALLAGLLLGAGAGIYYRLTIDTSAIPVMITWFAPIAIVIGLAEEIVFRGVAFSMLQKWPAYLTIPITSLLHASYKTILFLQPNIVHPIDTWFLFYTTFLAGLVLGFIRYAGKSVFPTMASHGLWDAIVYGDSPTAPWWVW
jgi:membrane protease YdiL (CAAX protease family)